MEYKKRELKVIDDLEKSYPHEMPLFWVLMRDGFDGVKRKLEVI